MKQVTHFLLVLLSVLLLFSHSTTYARLLTQSRDEQRVKADEITQAAESSLKIKEDDFSKLMGSEENECEDEEEEECLKRRMAAEAHLDYIYTQRHKPKANLP